MPCKQTLARLTAFGKPGVPHSAFPVLQRPLPADRVSIPIIQSAATTYLYRLARSERWLLRQLQPQYHISSHPQ